MQFLEQAPKTTLARLRGLVFDLDDTFLDHGRLDVRAYTALDKLKQAGLVLLVATGRPAGWGEVLTRMWPIDAAVSENGAIAHLALSHGVERLDTLSLEARRTARQKLAAIAAQVERDFPELTGTDDAHARISDITYDIGERQQLPATTVARVVDLAHSLGAHTSVSSVHLHLTLDRHDKATGCLHVLRERFSQDSTRALSDFAFIGDSGNDRACFAAFRTSIAVANLTGTPTLLPAYVTRAERSQGFVEAAELLLQARR